MTVSEKTKILIIGNYTQDVVSMATGETHKALGGPPAYISSVLNALKVPFQIIAKVGKDFEYHDSLIQPALISDGMSSNWHAQYGSHGHLISMRFASRCPPITIEDIQFPKELKLPYIIVSSSAMDFGPGLATHLRAHCETLLVDVQAFCRKIMPETGAIHFCNPIENGLKDWITSIDYIKVSQHESDQIDLQYLRQFSHVLLTKGREGCELFLKGSSTAIACPGFPAEEVDSTGAGDVFLGAFTAGLLRGEEPYEACRTGNYFGALAVSSKGVPSLDRLDPKLTEYPDPTRVCDRRRCN